MRLHFRFSTIIFLDPIILTYYHNVWLYFHYSLPRFLLFISIRLSPFCSSSLLIVLNLFSLLLSFPPTPLSTGANAATAVHQLLRIYLLNSYSSFQFSKCYYGVLWAPSLAFIGRFLVWFSVIVYLFIYLCYKGNTFFFIIPEPFSSLSQDKWKCISDILDFMYISRPLKYFAWILTLPEKNTSV